MQQSTNTGKMQHHLFGQEAASAQQKEKELLYAFYAKMNRRELISEITTYNMNLAFYNQRANEKRLNAILDKYNHLNKQIEAQLADKEQAPIKGPRSTSHAKWQYFKIFCMNQMHMDNGDTDKLKFIAQENDNDCEFPF